jgi:hypothetical protein
MNGWSGSRVPNSAVATERPPNAPASATSAPASAASTPSGAASSPLSGSTVSADAGTGVRSGSTARRHLADLAGDTCSVTPALGQLELVARVLDHRRVGALALVDEQHHALRARARGQLVHARQRDRVAAERLAHRVEPPLHHDHALGAVVVDHADRAQVVLALAADRPELASCSAATAR